MLLGAFREYKLGAISVCINTLIKLSSVYNMPSQVHNSMTFIYYAKLDDNLKGFNHVVLNDLIFFFQVTKNFDELLWHITFAKINSFCYAND